MWIIQIDMEQLHRELDLEILDKEETIMESEHKHKHADHNKESNNHKHQ